MSSGGENWPLLRVLVNLFWVTVIALAVGFYLVRPSIENGDVDHVRVIMYEESFFVEAGESCRIQLVESIPEGLVFNSTMSHLRTFDAWKLLLNITTKTIEIASSYWTLRSQDVPVVSNSSHEGQHIYDILKFKAESGIKIRIAQNLPSEEMPSLDTKELGKLDSVEVKSLNFSRLMGAGILHTKMWLVDRKHFYVGSANLDWRSLTQVKEMGILATNCPKLSADMFKIFDVYWRLGGNKTVPRTWPKKLSTGINPENPLKIANSPNETIEAYLSSSPPPFCPKGRVSDVDAIVRVLRKAKRFIYVAVMDYFPKTIYEKNPTFWPVIDNELRAAAIGRSVEVRLLLSNWTSTLPDMKDFLKSLTVLNNGDGVKIEGRFFTVPANREQKKIPFGRVNHNKYVVTDEEAIVGTSNWSADYFISTGGIGFGFKSIAENGGVRDDLKKVFLRDWESSYSSANL